MYHAIVRSFARKTFRRLNEGDLDRFLTVFGPDSTFCFLGDHELGGERRGLEEIRPLFEHMLVRFPDLRIEPITMIVRGWPWNTLMATRFRVLAHLPDGTPYRNEGMQFLRLRWGKVVEDRLYEDTAVLANALQLASR
jgi:ketosteroid isomerase-like protein